MYPFFFADKDWSTLPFAQAARQQLTDIEPWLRPSIQTSRRIARGVDLSMAPWQLSLIALRGAAEVSESMFSTFARNIAGHTPLALPRVATRDETAPTAH